MDDADAVNMSLLRAQLQTQTHLSQNAIRRFFRGDAVHPSTRKQLADALRARGLGRLIPMAHRDAA